MNIKKIVTISIFSLLLVNQSIADEENEKLVNHSIASEGSEKKNGGFFNKIFKGTGNVLKKGVKFTGKTLKKGSEIVFTGVKTVFETVPKEEEKTRFLKINETSNKKNTKFTKEEDTLVNDDSQKEEENSKIENVEKEAKEEENKKEEETKVGEINLDTDKKNICCWC